MNIVFFAHPAFLGHQSMPRFARLLADGMRERGHKVALWLPQARFFSLPIAKAIRKWLGYIDQYIIFPSEVRSRMKQCSPDTLFVFTDQALGPWVPLVVDRPHVIHCHDFLALRSALGEIPENKTSWTGRQYQDLIRRGFSQGKYFISVSQKTNEDLHRFLPANPLYSEVVYNGLNQSFAPYDPGEARILIGNKFGLNLTTGYLLHVGGNQFYKNRSGVIEIYDAWRSTSGSKMSLLLIGDAPSQSLLKVYEQSPFKSDIYFLSGVTDEFVRLAYSGASVFLFPSLAEGFGWPIAEAMASGCPVITTDDAPMTEVAGNAGFFIPRRPQNESAAAAWAAGAAKVVHAVVRISVGDHKCAVEAGLTNAKRFDPEVALNRIEAIYQNIIKAHKNP